MAITAQRKPIAKPSPKLTTISQLLKQKAPVGLALELDANTPSWSAHLRLLDGMLDALETFWDDEFIALNLVCPKEQHEMVASAIIGTPRLKLSFVDPESLDIGLPGILDGAGLTAQARGALVALICAANSQQESTLILNLETFPIRPTSSIDLYRSCEAFAQSPAAESASRAPAPVNWKPCGLFSRELARKAIPQILADARDLSESAGDRRASPALMKSMADAAASAELGFWHTDASSAAGGIPLAGELDAAECARMRGRGWSPQPWKTQHEHRFLRIVGGSRVDPEAVVAHIYATFHR